MFRKILRGIAAAFTTPDAVKAERSLAAIVVTRLLLALGASGALIVEIQKIIGG